MSEPIQIIKRRWDTHARSYDDANLLYVGSEWMDALGAHLPPDRDAEVVDVGAGTGFLSVYAARLGYTLCRCVDLSEEMLKIAGEHAREAGVTLDLIRGAAEDLPFESGSVDAVMNRWLLWTLLDPHAALREWLRILKKDGLLLCFCTVADEKYRTGAHYSEEVEELLPLKDASVEQLKSALRDSGFADVKAVAYLELFAHDPERNTWYLIEGRKR